MPKLGLALSVAAARPLRMPAGDLPPAAPSGIVVATTNAVNVSGNNVYVPVGTKTKVTSTTTRVAGSLISDKMFVDTGLVYLKEAGYGDVDYLTSPYGYILIPPNTTFTATFFNPLPSETFWRAGKVYGLIGEESNNFQFSAANNNPSIDATMNPTSGWGYAITITAA